MTPHLEAPQGAYADIVLLPGDPLRAQWIAETFLDGAACVNRVRNMLGFTGRYGGRTLSVQATGMGQPSLAIYATELIRHYGVKTLIRVGTCGALASELKLRDIVLATAASTDGAMNRLSFAGRDFAPAADFALLRAAADTADRMGIAWRAGGVLSADNFYAPDEGYRVWIEHGLLAVEMETSALYTIAARHRVRALTILTVSDHLAAGGSLTQDDRARALAPMVDLALEIARVLPPEPTGPTVVV